MTARARAFALAVLAATLAAASGCVTIGRQYEGAEVPIARLAAVKAGVSTKKDVLTQFGAPTLIQRRDLDALFQSLGSRYQGAELTVKLDPALLDDVYIYEYRRVNRTGVITGFFNYIKSVDKSDRLVFFFDKDGKVAGWGLTEGTKEL